MPKFGHKHGRIMFGSVDPSLVLDSDDYRLASKIAREDRMSLPGLAMKLV